jgi:arsenate reductase
MVDNGIPEMRRMAMRIYGLRNCETCRKAIKALPGAELVDIRETPLDPALLDRALAAFGSALVNTRSTTWRSLSEAERQGAPSALIAAHPAIMKRPLIVSGEEMHLGWSKDVRAALGAD